MKFVLLADKERESSTGDETSAEEEEGDASVEDQHIDVTVEGEERDVTEEGQPSEPPHRHRRKRTVTQWPEDTIVVTELTPARMPTERKAQIRMRKLAGLIARQRISLMLPSFNNLSEEDRWSLFDECVQPRLEFLVALKDRAFKMMMQMVAKSWRTHKSELV